MRLPDSLGEPGKHPRHTLKAWVKGTMGRAHSGAVREAFCKEVTSRLNSEEVLESAQCIGEAWAEGTILAETQKGD